MLAGGVRGTLGFELARAVAHAGRGGCDAVATAVGGVPDLLDDASGIVCPPRDPRALAAAISSALDRRQEIDSVALADRARRRFGYQEIERIWTQIYNEHGNGIETSA